VFWSLVPLPPLPADARNSVYCDEVAQIPRVRSAAADLLSMLQDARLASVASYGLLASSPLSFRFRSKIGKEKGEQP
jgi:hypothetical protein